MNHCIFCHTSHSHTDNVTFFGFSNFVTVTMADIDVNVVAGFVAAAVVLAAAAPSSKC
jgi:cytosine/uracil/thiamine/allantoin permease